MLAVGQPGLLPLPSYGPCQPTTAARQRLMLCATTRGEKDCRGKPRHRAATRGRPRERQQQHVGSEQTADHDSWLEPFRQTQKTLHSALRLYRLFCLASSPVFRTLVNRLRELAHTHDRVMGLMRLQG
jgi:hypothetical protein